MGGKKLSGYDGHGPRAEWLDVYVKYNGGPEFWETDGDGLVPNKKKDKFKDFLKDAGIVVYDNKAEGDKYTKCRPTDFSDLIVKFGAYSEVSWALILCNLVYTSDYSWYVNNLRFGPEYTVDILTQMLTDEMPNDKSGHGKANVINALKIALKKTPLGDGLFCNHSIDAKYSSSGKESLILNWLSRCTWINPNPEVILYSLYKFAEACGGMYQFSLGTLLDDTIERDGVSPTRIFGLGRDEMVPILNGLSSNYPDFISASFTLDLDNITLRDDKTSMDVLGLI